VTVARLATDPGGLTPDRAGFTPAGRQTEFHEVIATFAPFRPALPGRTSPMSCLLRQAPPPADASAPLIDASLMHQSPQHRPPCRPIAHRKSAPRAGFRRIAWSSHGIAKVDVAGSSPVSRSKTNGPPRTYASGPLSFDASAYLMRS
jgi:hypothetical protein